MKTAVVVCSECKSNMEKPAKELRRQRKSNPERLFYCSRVCYAKHAGRVNLDKSSGLFVVPGDRLCRKRAAQNVSDRPRRARLESRP